MQGVDVSGVSVHEDKTLNQTSCTAAAASTLKRPANPARPSGDAGYTNDPPAEWAETQDDTTTGGHHR